MEELFTKKYSLDPETFIITEKYCKFKGYIGSEILVEPVENKYFTQSLKDAEFTINLLMKGVTIKKQS